jgi:hypothetical protein
MSNSVMQLVDRKLELMKTEENTGRPMQQTTADFFTLADRRELLKQGVQLEQILRDLSDAKAAAKEALKDSTESTEAHEKRLRALEDDRLTLRTQISTAINTSRLWIVLISSVASAAMYWLMKLIGK